MNMYFFQDKNSFYSYDGKPPPSYSGIMFKNLDSIVFTRLVNPSICPSLR